MRTAPGVQAPGAVVCGWQRSESEMQETRIYEELPENLPTPDLVNALSGGGEGVEEICWVYAQNGN